MNKTSNKRKTLAFGLLLFSFLTANAQSLFKGKVLDHSTHTPIVGVSIVLQGTTNGTATNANGEFIIHGKDSEGSLLHCSFIGYKPLDITATSEVSLTIEMEKDTKSIHEVKVNGHQDLTPMEVSTMEPLSMQSTIQTITSQQIEDIGAISLMESMKYSVAGNLSEQGRKRRYFFSCRGQSSEVSIDGISLYTSTDLTSAISTSMIDKIENIRTSNTLLTGYSGLAGVINIHTKSFDSLTTSANVSYGTFNKLHANITNGAKFNHFGYALSVTKDKTDGPEDLNAAEDMWNLYGKLTYDIKDKLSISLQHFYMTGMREFAQMQEGDDYTIKPNYLAMLWKFDPLKFNVTLAKIKLYEGKNANTELQFYNLDAKRTWHKRAYYVDTTTKQVTDSVPSDYTITEEPYKVIGGGIIQTIRPVQNNYLRIGLMGSKYTYPTNTNYSGTSDDTDLRSFAGVFVDEHSFSKLDVNIGLKLLRDYYKRYTPSSVTMEDEWQPITANFSVGAAYNLSEKTILNTQISTGQLNADKQALKQVTVDGVTSEETIEDENRTSIDLGITSDLNKLGKWTFTGFFMNRKNASDYTGELYTNNQGVEAEYMENLDTKSYGVEIVWNSPVYGNWFSANANSTLMRTWETTEDVEEKYEETPEVMINAGLKAEKYGFTFTANGKYVSKYIDERFYTNLYDGQKIYIGDFVNIDLALNYKFSHLPLNIFGRITNLADEHYSTTTPVYRDYGRQYAIGVKGEF